MIVHCRHRSVPPFAGASPGALACDCFARCLRDNHEPAHSPYADPSDLGATQKAGKVAPRFYMTVATLTKRWPGREEQVQRLVGAVSAAGAPALFVYGASSTGKTSVVRQALPADFDMGVMLAGVSHPIHSCCVAGTCYESFNTPLHTSTVLSGLGLGHCCSLS